MPKRYDLQNIPDAYNVEIRNMFSAINLVEREPEEMWQEIKNSIMKSAKFGYRERRRGTHGYPNKTSK